MDIQLKAHRTLIAVAEEASFSAAARRMNVPQPWVSTQIKRWEEAAGFPIFIRSHHPGLPVETTERGKAVIEQVRRVVAEADALNALLQSNAAEIGSIEIGTDPITSEINARTTLLERITQRFPDFSAHFRNVDDERSLQELQRGHIDLALIIGPAPNTKLYRSKVLQKLRLDLLMPKEHPLAKLEYVPLAELRGLDIVMPVRPTHPMSDRIIQFWESLGVNVIESMDSHLLATTRIAQRSRQITTTLIEHTPLVWGLTDMVQRPLETQAFALEFRVVALRSPARASVNKIWLCIA